MRPLRPLLLLLASLPALACDGSSDALDRFDLLIEVSATGDATATRIEVIGGNSGDPVVDNPTLPWQLFMFAIENDSVQVIVDGTANNGELSAVIQDNPNVDPNPGTYAMESCGPMVPACMIDVQHDF